MSLGETGDEEGSGDDFDMMVKEASVPQQREVSGEQRRVSMLLKEKVKEKGETVHTSAVPVDKFHHSLRSDRKLYRMLSGRIVVESFCLLLYLQLATEERSLLAQSVA